MSTPIAPLTLGGGGAGPPPPGGPGGGRARKPKKKKTLGIRPGGGGAKKASADGVGKKKASASSSAGAGKKKAAVAKKPAAAKAKKKDAAGEEAKKKKAVVAESETKTAEKEKEPNEDVDVLNPEDEADIDRIANEEAATTVAAEEDKEAEQTSKPATATPTAASTAGPTASGSGTTKRQRGGRKSISGAIAIGSTRSRIVPGGSGAAPTIDTASESGAAAVAGGAMVTAADSSAGGAMTFVDPGTALPTPLGGVAGGATAAVVGLPAPPIGGASVGAGLMEIPPPKAGEKTMGDYCTKFRTPRVPKADKQGGKRSASGGAGGGGGKRRKKKGTADAAAEGGMEDSAAGADTVGEGEEADASATAEDGAASEADASGTGPGADDGRSGPLVEVINGEIVIKEATLTVGARRTTQEIDREMGAEGDEATIVEEASGVTATYTSFTARQRPQHWGVEETRTFYNALRQCGTDFTLMTGFFPAGNGQRGRTRRQLKSKFLAESRRNPKLIELALKNRIALDVSVFGPGAEEAVQKAREEVDNPSTISATMPAPATAASVAPTTTTQGDDGDNAGGTTRSSRSRGRSVAFADEATQESGPRDDDIHQAPAAAESTAAMEDDDETAAPSAAPAAAAAPGVGLLGASSTASGKRGGKAKARARPTKAKPKGKPKLPMRNAAGKKKAAGTSTKKKKGPAVQVTDV